VTVNHWLSGMYDDHTYGASWFDEEDVSWIAAQGFDHLRFRVSGHEWTKPDGSLEPAKLAPFDRALTWAKAHRLGVVISVTSVPGVKFAHKTPADFGDEKLQASAALLWGAIARRYAGEGDALRFELLHSPDAKQPAPLYAMYRRALAAIRESSPTRVVYLVPNQGRTDNASDQLLLDDHTALSFVYWEVEDKSSEGIAAGLAKLGTWAAIHARGRELYVAELPVCEDEDPDVTRQFITSVKAAVEKHGIGWAAYDYESGCAVRGKDGSANKNLEALALNKAR
jgi:endoglucanase